VSSTTSLTTARSLSDRLLDLDHSRRLSPGRLPRRAGHGPLSGVARVADSAYEFCTPIQGFCRFDSFYWGCCRRILRDRGEPVDTNPTLSANSRSFVFNNLAGRSGFSRAIAGNDAKKQLDLRLADRRKQARSGHVGFFHGHVGACSTLSTWAQAGRLDRSCASPRDRP
jgi:hypothetical protein